MRRRGLLWALWAAAGLAGLAALAGLRAWVPPEDPRLSICLLRNATGLPCPGCGMTRAFAHLAKGEWAAARRDHPLVFPLAAEGVVAWLVWPAWGLAGVREGRRNLLDDPRLAPVLLGHAAVLVAFWTGRLATGTLPW
jgi:hypothetical protein